MTIALYYSPGSCSFAPHVVLREIGLTFELRKFSTADRGNYSPSTWPSTPRASSNSLDRRFHAHREPGHPRLPWAQVPRGWLVPVYRNGDEARCLEWLAWSSNTVHVAFAQILRPERFVPSEDAYPPVQASGHVNFQRCLAEIETHLTRSPFAVGSRFTVVDPFWLVFYRWGVRQGYEIKRLYPAYTRYAEVLSQRPSLTAALSVEGISLWE